MWREVLRIINEGTVEGLAQSKAVTHDRLFLQNLRHSNEVFAAFKVHTMGVEMAAKLIGEDGKLKPFDKWRQDVASICSHQTGAWLRTEYDTAVIRAHAAADWQEFQRNRDIMPNLRWMPTTSPQPESSHAAYWRMKLTLPIDDPFWNDHHPGDRWNCKCSLEATDEPVNRPDDIEPSQPQRGLENNPGKDGHTFSDNHPYFPQSCATCPVRGASGFTDKLKGLFRNAKKDCYNCPFIDGCVDRLSEIERQNRKTYNHLKNDENYFDVEFDEISKGVKAVHKGHNFDKVGGEYEKEAQIAGMKSGNIVILENEQFGSIGQRFTEGHWNGRTFEVAGCENGTANNILRGLKHCASKRKTEIAVIVLPKTKFDKEIFDTALNRYKGLKKLNDGQYVHFEKVICIYNKEIVYNVDNI